MVENKQYNSEESYETSLFSENDMNEQAEEKRFRLDKKYRLDKRYRVGQRIKSEMAKRYRYD